MALFKINSGNEEDLFKYKINESTQQEELAVPFNPGWAYFSPDTGNFFIDSPLKDGATLTKENIKEYRIQLNANKADFLLKETNNAGIYEIQPEKGVLQTNPIEQFNEILNDGEYIKLLQTTEQHDNDKNPIFPQTLGRAVYIDINGSTYDLQTAISQGLFYKSLINETVIISEITQTIPIPNTIEIIDEKQLLVFQNGLLLNKMENYTLNTNKTEINLVGSNYKTRIGDIFNFICFPYLSLSNNISSGGTTFPVVTVINSSSGDSQVPTAKAVYTYVNGLVNNSY